MCCRWRRRLSSNVVLSPQALGERADTGIAAPREQQKAGIRAMRRAPNGSGQVGLAFRMPPSTDQSVDVVIAAWNSATTIERAVRSALADPAVSHVIVIDDASDDDTAARAAAVTDSPHLIVRKLPSNAGPSRARNVALELSTAAWISVLDADDYFDGPRIGELL